MSKNVKLDSDEDGVKVNQTMYRGLIPSIKYVTTTRKDIFFSGGYVQGFKLHLRRHISRMPNTFCDTIRKPGLQLSNM